MWRTVYWMQNIQAVITSIIKYLKQENITDNLIMYIGQAGAAETKLQGSFCLISIITLLLKKLEKS